MKPCATMRAVCSAWWELELLERGNHQHFLPSRNSSQTVDSDRWTPSRIGLALCWHASFHVRTIVKVTVWRVPQEAVVLRASLQPRMCSASRLTTKPHWYCFVPHERVVRPGNKSWSAYLCECLQAALLFDSMSHTLKVENTVPEIFTYPVTHFSAISDNLWN